MVYLQYSLHITKISKDKIKNYVLTKVKIQSEPVVFLHHNFSPLLSRICKKCFLGILSVKLLKYYNLSIYIIYLSTVFCSVSIYLLADYHNAVKLIYMKIYISEHIPALIHNRDQ